ncbi:MAG: hypothetical protein NTY08_09090 [Proteobacteria bacterium]|nr:hypothetical protein [Pseudomonadota bacterium]
MNDAKKLDNPSSTPAVDAHALIEVQAAVTHEPLIEFKSGEATRLTMRAPVSKQARSLARRLAMHMLIFFLIALVMFGVGAGLAFALFNGALDSYTGQLKELTHQARDLMQQYIRK